MEVISIFLLLIGPCFGNLISEGPNMILHQNVKLSHFVMFPDQFKPFVVHISPQYGTHAKLLRDIKNFACSLKPNLPSGEYKTKWKCNVEHPREKRFLFGLISGLVGAGTGIAALSKVKELKKVMEKELAGIKGALENSNSAIKQVGGQVFALTKGVRKMDEKVEFYHRQTTSNMKIINNAVLKLKNDVNKALAQLRNSTEARLKDIVISTTLDSISTLEYIIAIASETFGYADRLAEESIVEGFIPSWYFDLPAIAKNLAKKMCQSEECTVSDIEEALKQKLNVVIIHGKDYMMTGLLATGMRYPVYTFEALPLLDLGWLWFARLPNMVYQNNRYKEIQDDGYQCYKHGYTSICLHEGVLVDTKCSSSVSVGQLRGCKLGVAKFKDKCYAKLLSPESVYVSGTCEVKEKEKTYYILGSSSVKIGHTKFDKIAGIKLSPLLVTNSSYLYVYQGVNGVHKFIRTEIDGATIDIGAPKINTSTFDVDLPNNSWYGAFQVNLKNSSKLTAKIGEELAKMKILGIPTFGMVSMSSIATAIIILIVVFVIMAIVIAYLVYRVDFSKTKLA